MISSRLSMKQGVLLALCMIFCSSLRAGVRYQAYFCATGDVVAINMADCIVGDVNALAIKLLNREELGSKFKNKVPLLSEILKKEFDAFSPIELRLEEAGIAERVLALMYEDYDKWQSGKVCLTVYSDDVSDYDFFRYVFPSVVPKELRDGPMSPHSIASSSSNEPIYDVRKTDLFYAWYEKQDIEARKKINDMIEDLQYRELVKSNKMEPCKTGYNARVFELKSTADEGRRVYFTVQNRVITLLNGGNKNTDQVADIDAAASIAFKLKQEAKAEKVAVKAAEEARAKKEKKDKYLGRRAKVK